MQLNCKLVVMQCSCLHDMTMKQNLPCADFIATLVESLGYLAPGSPADLRRILDALQAALLRDAVLPSHASVICTAAIRAASALARRLQASEHVAAVLKRLTWHSALTHRVRTEVAIALIQLEEPQGPDAVLRCTTAVLLADLDGAAVLAAASESVAAAAAIANASRKRPRGGQPLAPARPSLAAIAAVHAYVGRHAQPAIRHEAFRLVRVASGALPSLVDASTIEQALAAGSAGTSMRTIIFPLCPVAVCFNSGSSFDAAALCWLCAAACMMYYSIGE
jgi:hypothetical protein